MNSKIFWMVFDNGNGQLELKKIAEIILRLTLRKE